MLYSQWMKRSFDETLAMRLKSSLSALTWGMKKKFPIIIKSSEFNRTGEIVACSLKIKGGSGVPVKLQKKLRSLQFLLVFVISWNEAWATGMSVSSPADSPARMRGNWQIKVKRECGKRGGEGEGEIYERGVLNHFSRLKSKAEWFSYLAVRGKIWARLRTLTG